MLSPIILRHPILQGMFIETPLEKGMLNSAGVEYL
jgi:hypothetical protein